MAALELRTVPVIGRCVILTAARLGRGGVGETAVDSLQVLGLEVFGSRHLRLWPAVLRSSRLQSRPGSDALTSRWRA